MRKSRTVAMSCKTISLTDQFWFNFGLSHKPKSMFQNVFIVATNWSCFKWAQRHKTFLWSLVDSSVSMTGIFWPKAGAFILYCGPTVIFWISRWSQKIFYRCVENCWTGKSGWALINASKSLLWFSARVLCFDVLGKKEKEDWVLKRKHLEFTPSSSHQKMSLCKQKERFVMRTWFYCEPLVCTQTFCSMLCAEKTVRWTGLQHVAVNVSKIAHQVPVKFFKQKYCNMTFWELCVIFRQVGHVFNTQTGQPKGNFQWRWRVYCGCSYSLALTPVEKSSPCLHFLPRVRAGRFSDPVKQVKVLNFDFIRLHFLRFMSECMFLLWFISPEHSTWVVQDYSRNKWKCCYLLRPVLSYPSAQQLASLSTVLCVSSTNAPARDIHLLPIFNSWKALKPMPTDSTKVSLFRDISASRSSHRWCQDAQKTPSSFRCDENYVRYLETLIGQIWRENQFQATMRYNGRICSWSACKKSHPQNLSFLGRQHLERAVWRSNPSSLPVRNLRWPELDDASQGTEHFSKM